MRAKLISLKDVQITVGPVAPGFDYLRLGLALYVLLSHCFSIAEPGGSAQWVWSGWFGPFHRSALPMFFALSGFLVAGSFNRNSLVDFVALRVLRIVPALAFEVFLTALVLGSCFTRLPLPDYYSSPGFWAYFLNLLGDIHYELPGVFGGARINGQLWTIPIEMNCYLSLVVLGVCGGARRKSWLLAVAAGVSITMTALAVKDGLIHHGPVAPRLVLVLAFLFGVLIHFYHDVVPLHFGLFAASVAGAIVALGVADLAFLAPAPLAYATVYIGYARLPAVKFGDLSYGLYLFHYPVLAAIFAVSGGAADWRALLACGLPTTLLLAAVSWVLVERPVLRRKGAALAGLARLTHAFSQSSASKSAALSS